MVGMEQQSQPHNPRVPSRCRICRVRVAPGRSGMYPATCSRRCKGLDRLIRQRRAEQRVAILVDRLTEAGELDTEPVPA